jgi:hypothetical protein
MRLHLAAARREIVGFVDDQDGAADRGGARLGLGESLGNPGRKLADMPAASNVGRRFETNDTLVDGAGNRRRDAGCKGCLAATYVAGEKNEGEG